MKPMPKKYHFLFPDAYVPERPWWHSASPLDWPGVAIIMIRQGGYRVQQHLEREPSTTVLVHGWWTVTKDGNPVKGLDLSGDRIEPILAQIDRMNPIPAPELFCGQVWVNSVTGHQHMLTQVHPGNPNARCSYQAMLMMTLIMDRDYYGSSVPLDILISGPHSPWSEPEKSCQS
jgi:hypothetical protein